MRLLVIGGTQFIGKATVGQLQALGHQVVVFHRGVHESHADLDVQHIHGDVQRLPDFANDFARFAPDVVLATVAYTQHDGELLMRTFAGTTGRLVVLSSMDVYRAYGRVKRIEPGPPDPVPLSEDAPLRSVLYPDADAGDFAQEYENVLVERAVLANPALPATILRLPAVYGPDDYHHRVAHYLRRMDDKRPFILLDDAIAQWRWTRGYVENVAAAIACAVLRPEAAGRIYNLGEPDALGEAAWVRAIGRAAQWEGEVVVVPQAHLPASFGWWNAYDLRQDWVCDTTRFRGELGFAEPIEREEALQRTVTWERSAFDAAVGPTSVDYAAEDAAWAALR